MNEAYCAPPEVPGLAARLLADTDCQAFGLVERGYAALAQPGGAVSAALTGLMIVAVALFGYRLLLGRGALLSDAVGLAVRIGVVLLIATSWESWQTLAYETLARAPSRIAGEMLSGVAARDPLAGIQVALNKLEAAGVGYRTRAGIASPLVGGPASAAAVLNISALILTVATVGLLVAARVVLALLLAIAPVMAGFILFEATRNMAAGWITAMVTAALVPLFVLTLAAVELAVLIPLVNRLLAEQAAGVFENASVTPIGLVVLVFAIATLAAIRAGGTIARGIRLPRRKTAPTETTAVETTVVAEAAPPPPAAPAAARVAQALESLARREGGSGSLAIGTRQVAAALGSATVRETRTATMTMGDGALPVRRPPPARIPRRTRSSARRDA